MVTILNRRENLIAPEALPGVDSVHTLPTIPTGPKIPQLLKVTGPLNGCWT